MTGKRIILPSSFTVGPRDMNKRYMDGMALVQKFGKPDIFLTITCNPNWPELKDQLRYNDESQNRLDLLTRIFRAKLEELKIDIFKNKIFGSATAYIFVIEFEKRGLPHAHFLIILDHASKIIASKSIDKFVSAEIPDRQTYPHLYSVVVAHMIHGPCGILNPTNACMNRNKQCISHFPKDYTTETFLREFSYPKYRRVNNGRKVKVRGQWLDNRWIVPYNPYLLAKFNCHINIEICSTIKAVKYLYKYVYKGHNRIGFSIHFEEHVVDKIKNFQTTRWISPPEALWRIFGFVLSKINPPVVTLQLHLENNNFFTYKSSDNLEKFEASEYQMSTPFRCLFATILTLCAPNDPKNLWNKFKIFMIEDFIRAELSGKSINSYGFVSYNVHLHENEHVARVINDELSINVSEIDIMCPHQLNTEQKMAYNAILNKVDTNVSSMFFVDGLGGTGKTFLYRALLGAVRSRQMIALATASSGVAAGLLPGGQTTHSKFKIPLEICNDTICNISKQSALAGLFRMTKLIIWDEAPMVNRYVVEALDKMLRDINDCEFPFGGKIVVLGGDFRQVLPVVQRGTKDDVIGVSLVNSYLWPLFTKLRLSENMRAQLNTSFCKYLLDIGDGTTEKHSCDMVQLPPDITIDFEEHITSLQSLIDIVYPNLDRYVDNLHYMINRVILTSKNEYVDEINNLLISHFPRDSFTYFSFDEAIGTTD
ncbi:uncharacterized protein LOC111371960 [Olea europaea var. sylvestris]|uniref:uncharacterized protein LOC111371960 n=1 Tax=Olea europaea var. sylvestris TaxID=158386 RepID=UPI000C1D362D|nr:uncharacterized protein LOC111371960 [Olea europaea var. sylvestris]